MASEAIMCIKVNQRNISILQINNVSGHWCIYYTLQLTACNEYQCLLMSSKQSILFPHSSPIIIFYSLYYIHNKETRKIITFILIDKIQTLVNINKKMQNHHVMFFLLIKILKIT